MVQQSSLPDNQEGNVRQKGVDEKFCESCGEIIKNKAELCPKCGVRQKGMVSKTALLLITFFLGGIGAHKFYLQKNWQGVFYLLFCWTGIPGLIALVEFIIYAFTSSENLQEKYSASGAGVVIAVVACAIGLLFIIGILAAIAIPQFVMFKQRASQATVKAELQNVLAAEQAYYSVHNRFSTNVSELNFVPTNPSVTVEIMGANEACFEAVGTHSQLQEPLWINCDGLVQQN